MRIMLDTNIWSRLFDRSQGDAFLELEHRLGLEVIVPPSTLLEALQTPNVAVRDGIVAIMTSRRRVHPPTEAQMEAEELVSEARRCRSSWLRQRPTTDRIHGLETFWRRKVWQLARDNPGEAARRLLVSNERAGTLRNMESLVRYEKETRRRIIDEGFNIRCRDLPHLVADLADSPEQLKAGSDGKPTEPWRVETAGLFWRELVTIPPRAHRTGEDHTFADWALPWLNPSKWKGDRADWNRFFYRDVVAAAMPRNWLRWAVRYTQYGVKVSSGNPADEQHSAYLLDADVFLTGDTRYAGLLNGIRVIAPVPIAEAKVIPADTVDVVTAIYDRIS